MAPFFNQPGHQPSSYLPRGSGDQNRFGAGHLTPSRDFKNDRQRTAL